MRWFEAQIRRGYADVQNPVRKDLKYRVSLVPEEVHSIVLWSKNFQPFLDSNLSKSNCFRWYFNFSLVDCPEWEPHVPLIEDRLAQLKIICQKWSPLHINWRFDPGRFLGERKEK